MYKSGIPDLYYIIRETRDLNLIQKIIVLLNYFGSLDDRKFLEKKLVDFSVRMIEQKNQDPSTSQLYFIVSHLKYSTQYRRSQQKK